MDKSSSLTAMSHFIRASIKLIKEAQNTGRLVIFIGSGISVNSGLPKWGDIVHELALDIGLSKDNSDYTPDDFLRIPQIHFNQRGYVEYISRVTRLFPRVKPNSLHDVIFQLKPEHFITTNYDDLLEQQMRITGIPYHVVTQDSDLPLSRSRQMLVKMHGDLSRNNIVLKEDDYLSYTNNFRLIENVVKSLFATHVVIFLGFSATDSNFKLIYQWVKDALKGTIQPAYLIQTGRSYDHLEFDYFRGKGINILYSSELGSEIWEHITNSHVDTPKDLVHQSAIDLYNFMHFIIHFDDQPIIKISQHTLPSLISYVYKRLHDYQNTSALLPEHIIEALEPRRKGIALRYNEIIVVDEALASLLKGLEGYTSAKSIISKYAVEIRYIHETLQKAGIVRIVIKDDKLELWIKPPKLPPTTSRIRTRLEKFDFSALEQYVETSTIAYISEDNCHQALEQSRVLFEIGHPLRAYRLLSAISTYAIKSKNDWLWFVSVFNRKRIVQILWANFLSYRHIEYESLSSLQDEVESLSVSLHLSRYKYDDKPLANLISDVDNFSIVSQTRDTLKEVFDDAVEAYEKIKKGLENIYSPPLSARAQFHILSLENFIDTNNLILVLDSTTVEAYTYFVKVELFQYKTQMYTTEGDYREGLYGEIVKGLKYHTLASAIRFVNSDELDTFIQSIGIDEIGARPETIDDLIEAFTNFATFVTTVAINIRFFSLDKHVRNFAIIFSALRLSDVQLDQVINNLQLIIRRVNLEERWLPLFERFLTRNSPLLIDKNDKLLGLLSNFMRRVLSKGSGMIEWPSTRSFIRSIVALLQHQGSAYYIPDNYTLNTDVSNTIKIWNPQDATAMSHLIMNILIPLYEVMPSQVRRQISGFIKNYLKKPWNPSAPDIYYSALIKEIISPTLRLSRRFLNAVLARFSTLESVRRRHYFHARSAHIAAIQFAELYASKKITLATHPSVIKEVRLLSPYVDFIIAPHQFDFSKFDLAWLASLPDRTLTALASNKSIRSGIIDQYKKIASNSSVDEDTVRLIARWFL